MGSLQHFLNSPISVPFSPNLNHRRSFFLRACLNLDVHSPDSVKPKTHLKSREVMEMEGKVLVGTYARNPVVISSGKGCKLYDPEGREYLDCTSGIAVNALGHGDPDWVKAVVEQANLLTHVSNVFYSVPQVMGLFTVNFFFIYIMRVYSHINLILIVLEMFFFI